MPANSTGSLVVELITAPFIIPFCDRAGIENNIDKMKNSMVFLYIKDNSK